MWVNDPLRMELMSECLMKWPTFLMQERPWSPSLLTYSAVTTVAFCGLKNVQRAIAIRSSSGLSRYLMHAIRKASDQAEVWLFSAVSSWLLLQGLRVPSGAVSESLQVRSLQADCVSFRSGDE